MFVDNVDKNSCKFSSLLSPCFFFIPLTSLQQRKMNRKTLQCLQSYACLKTVQTIRKLSSKKVL